MIRYKMERKMNTTEIIKPNVSLVQKKHIYYELDETGQMKHRPAWLGDSFAFLYDSIMKKSVFPKKFAGSWDDHHRVLKELLSSRVNQYILELGTGSGIAAQWLQPSVHYAGVDVSAGLLKRAVTRFSKAGFNDSDFYVADVNDLPFQNEIFDVCLCILTMNFFENLKIVVAEIQRVLKSGSLFYGCVPIPDRLERNSKIQGTLRSEQQLRDIFEQYHFSFVPLPVQNGALYYFSGEKI